MIKLEIFTSSSANLELLEENLSNLDIHSLSATEMKVLGKENIVKEHYRGVERASRHPQKLKIEIVMPKECRLQVFQILKDSLKDEQQSNTKIFTTPMWQTRSMQGGFYH